jgi:hypothetical protein
VTLAGDRVPTPDEELLEDGGREVVAEHAGFGSAREHGLDGFLERARVDLVDPWKIADEHRIPIADDHERAHDPFDRVDHERVQQGFAARAVAVQVARLTPAPVAIAARLAAVPSSAKTLAAASRIAAEVRSSLGHRPGRVRKMSD